MMPLDEQYTIYQKEVLHGLYGLIPRQGAWWLFLRWKAKQERADWPSVTEMPTKEVSHG